GTPHRSFEFRVLWTLIFGLIRRQVYLRFTIYDLRFFGGEMGETILTNGKRLRPHIFFGAVASRYYNGVQQVTTFSQRKNLRLFQAIGLIAPGGDEALAQP